MKVSRSQTGCMCVYERNPGGAVRLQGVDVNEEGGGTYCIGSTFQSNGECGKGVKKRAQSQEGVRCDA